MKVWSHKQNWILGMFTQEPVAWQKQGFFHKLCAKSDTLHQPEKQQTENAKQTKGTNLTRTGH
jgi:hypothetical protein